MSMHMPPVFASSDDHEVLVALQKTLEGSTSPGPVLLAAEIARLSVVDPKDQAPFVKIRSRVTYRDLQRPGVRTGRLLMPVDIRSQEDCISLMAPVGAALLGLSVDDFFAWEIQASPAASRFSKFAGEGRRFDFQRWMAKSLNMLIHKGFRGARRPVCLLPGS